MAWFNKKRNPRVEVTNTEDQDSRVEVIVNKNATQEAVAKADEANHHLNELLVENGFTLKIYLAAGGKYKKEHKQ